MHDHKNVNQLFGALQVRHLHQHLNFLDRWDRNCFLRKLRNHQEVDHIVVALYFRNFN